MPLKLIGQLLSSRRRLDTESLEGTSVCTCKMHIPKLELWMYVGLSEMIWDLMGDFPTSEVGFPLPRISKVYTDMIVLNYN